jgi:hypothetical protein
MVECGAFVVSALAGGVLAEATSARTTYFVTLPFAAAAIVGFLRFEEPRLHRAAGPSSLRSHLALTLRTTVWRREVSRSAGSAASRACRTGRRAGGRGSAACGRMLTERSVRAVPQSPQRRGSRWPHHHWRPDGEGLARGR